jgi:hypothetical protein
MPTDDGGIRRHARRTSLLVSRPFARDVRVNICLIKDISICLIKHMFLGFITMLKHSFL